MLRDKSILENFDLVEALDDQSAALYSGGKLVCEIEKSQLDAAGRLLDEAQSQCELGFCDPSIFLALEDLLRRLQDNCRQEPDIF